MALLSPGRNLVLIGMMGVGKSTVGRILARELGRPFVDTDEVVEAQEGRSIADIVTRDGERAFRALEAAAVRRVTALRGQVIAAGGGAVLDPANVTNLHGNGDLVWLDAPASALAMHLSAAGEHAARPLLQTGEDLQTALARLREERAETYRRAAAVHIDTQGRPPEVIADEVLAWARTQPGLLAREERT